MGRFTDNARQKFGIVRSKEQGDQAAAARQTFKANARRTAHLRRAEDLAAHLPGPNESVHCLMTGRYDLMMAITACLNRLGPAEHLRMATLSYGVKNLDEMLLLYDSKKARRMTLLTSAFFRDASPQTWTRTKAEYEKRGQLAAAARNHCKVIVMHLASGRRIIIEGSANLRCSSNIEQIAVIDSPELADFHALWIDDFVKRHILGDEEDHAKPAKKKERLLFAD